MTNRFDKIEDTDEQGHLKAGYQVEDSDEQDSGKEGVKGEESDDISDDTININNPIVGDSIYDPPEAAQ